MMKSIKKAKTLLCLVILLFTVNWSYSQDRFFTKSGKVSFLSYTLVEDIKADNHQTLSIIDTNNGDIVIKILIRSFRFKKALMQEHFNENYMESHKFPKAIFKGKINNYTTLHDDDHTEIVGKLTIRGLEKEINIATKIKKNKKSITLTGHFKVQVSDFDIKIPSIVSKNISKIIEITFELTHKPYKL